MNDMLMKETWNYLFSLDEKDLYKREDGCVSFDFYLFDELLKAWYEEAGENEINAEHTVGWVESYGDNKVHMVVMFWEEGYEYYEDVGTEIKDLPKKLQNYIYKNFSEYVEDMIKCGIDPSIPDDSECAWCCIYCEKKDECKYICPIVKESKTENDIYNSTCEYI